MDLTQAGKLKENINSIFDYLKSKRSIYTYLDMMRE